MSEPERERERAAAEALARGAPAEVRAHYEAASPEDDAARARWALLLVEAGEPALAAALAERVEDLDERERLRELAVIERVPATEADEEDESLDAAELAPDRTAPSDADVVRTFLRWFGGRRDLYAQQWYDERRRRGGYRPVREPLTEDVARAHLAGRRTLGQYLLHSDDTVSFAVVDLDLSASAVAELEAAHGPGTVLRHRGLRAYARALLETGARLGLPLFPEDSGQRGAHLWLFFAPRRPARAARMLLRRLIDAAGPPPADVGVEIFPKQDTAGERGLSSLVKLPCGVHQVTLRRCSLLDPELAPIDDVRAALARLAPADPARVDAILGARLFALPPPVAPGDPAERAPSLPTHGTPRTLAGALRALGDGPEARRAAEGMVDACAVLRALVNRAYSTERLTADEARALIYSVGLTSPRLATDVLSAAGVPMRELHRVQRGLPSPVGCKKLRALGIAPCEACPRGDAAQPYPTPVVFAVGVVPAGPPRSAPFAGWLETDALAPDAVEQLTAELHAVKARLRRLEGEGDGGGEPGPEGA